MHVSTHLLIWNVAHMQSRVKVHHVAVLTRKFLPILFSKGFLRFSSTLATKFGRSLTPGDNRVVMSPSPFDCNRSPDAWTEGFWDSIRPDDDEAFCHPIKTPSKCDASGFLVEPGTCNRSPEPWSGFSWPGSSVC